MTEVLDEQCARRARALAERIEDTYDKIVEQYRLHEYARWTMRAEEAAAIANYPAEWAAARNKEARSAMIASWLIGHEEYHEARADRDNAKLELQLALLEAERLTLLAEAKKVTSGQTPQTPRHGNA